MSAGKRCDLHGRHGRVAYERRDDADADGDARGCREGHGRRREPAMIEIVLVYPELIEAALLREPIRLDQSGDRYGARD